MKYIVLILLAFSVPTFSQELSADQIQEIYTTAIDAEFAGDYAKARYELELLQDNNVTNEYVLNSLLNVYRLYITQLIQQKDQQTLQVAYPEIRQNIIKILDEHSDNITMHEEALRITWLLRDIELGVSIAFVLLQEDRNNYLANVFLGVYYYSQSEKYQLGIPFLQRVAESKKQDADPQVIYQARYYLADSFFRLKQYDRARYYFNQAEQMQENPALSIRKALLNTHDKKYAEAYTNVQQIPVSLLGAEPYDIYVATVFGRVFLDGDTNLRPELLQLINKKHDTPFTRSLVQFFLGRSQRALSILKEDKFLNETLPFVYYSYQEILYKNLNDIKGLDQSYLKLAQFESAVSDPSLSLEYLQKITEQTPEVKRQLARAYYQLFEYEKALQIFQAIDKDKRDAEAQGALVELNALLGNTDQARQYLEDVNLDKLPSYWKELYNACILYHEKKYSEAETILKSIPVQNVSPTFSYFYASVLLQQKKYEEAQKILDEVYKEFPYDLTILNLVAYSNALQGKNLEESKLMIERVIAEKPNNISFLDTLLLILVKQNDLTSAKEIADKIILLLPQNKKMNGIDEIMANLALYFQAIGNTDEADTYFKEALSINPDSSYIKELTQ